MVNWPTTRVVGRVKSKQLIIVPDRVLCIVRIVEVRYTFCLWLYSYCTPTRVSKFSKNLFPEIFEAHSKIIYFRKISTIFFIIFAKFFNQFSRKFSNKFSRKWKFSQKCSAPVAHIYHTLAQVYSRVCKYLHHRRLQELLILP